MPNNFQSNKSGISYIEILITLLIIGLMTAFVVPSFLGKQSRSPKKLFFASFATLMQESLAQAIVTNSIHQIFFDIKDRKIIVKIHDSTNPNEQNKFVPVPENSTPQPIAIPENLIIQNFFINGVDDVKGSQAAPTIWFYIMPDGTSQSIIINIEDTDAPESAQHQFALTVNPFYSQVKEYDAFQKP